MVRRSAIFLLVVFVVVVANYVAQVPYYLRLYYFPHHAPPALWGTLALAATLAWFLVGFALLWRGRRGLLADAVVPGDGDGVLPLQLHQPGHPWLPAVLPPGRIPIRRCWTVFAIGYLNMLAGVVFVVLS